MCTWFGGTVCDQLQMLCNAGHRHNAATGWLTACCWRCCWHLILVRCIHAAALSRWVITLWPSLVRLTALPDICTGWQCSHSMSLKANFRQTICTIASIRACSIAHARCDDVPQLWCNLKTVWHLFAMTPPCQQPLTLFVVQVYAERGISSLFCGLQVTMHAH